jgi:hypothetical protein
VRNNQNRSRFILGSLLVAGMLCANSARAAFDSSNFETLLAELQSRSLTLSNSTDKAEIKQKKACDKAIKAIVKPTKDLGTDIKTAGKVAKTLAKAFTNEFDGVTRKRAIASLNGISNLEDLLFNVYSGLATDVETILIVLKTAISELPEGSDKIKAQAAFDSAQVLLEQVLGSSDFALVTKLLSTSLKNTIKGAKIAAKGAGGSGGGGGGDFMTATVKVGANASFKWDADAFNPMWIQAPGNFQVNGVRGTDSEITIVFTGFTPATGMYSLGAGNGDYVVFSPITGYNVTSGTLTLTKVDIANKTVAGTFSFTASDGTTTVTVSNGQFNMTNLMTF